MMANETRLIDANALDEKLEILKVRFKAQGRDAVAEDYNFVQTVLLTAPTVDAVEVVHGRWIHDQVKGNYSPIWFDVMRCSVCKEFIDGSYGTNYCPNCGAKMDGERKDNDNA